MVGEPQRIGLEKWLNLHKTYRVLTLALILILIVFFDLFLDQTGGSVSFYVYSIYILILLGAIFYKVPGGIFTALAGGLALDAFAPIDDRIGSVSVVANWMYRILVFLLVGGFAGYMVAVFNENIRRMRWLAFHNPDTGLPNRTALIENLAGVTSSASPGQRWVVVIIQMNNYVEIVNAFGVKVIDALIEQVYLRIRSLFPNSALVYQIMPHVFGAFLPENGHHRAVIDSILDVANRTFEIETIPIYVDLCLGVAIYPEHGDQPLALVRKALVASETAQERGVSFVSYDDLTDRKSIDSLALFGTIPEAIRLGQFELLYQPILDIQSNEVTSVEALIRWHHPSRGLIYPGQFIPQIENTALISEITKWVLDTAIRQLAEWQHAGLNLCMTVNISARLFQDPDLVRVLEGLIASYGIRTEGLVLEITENTIMMDPEHAFVHLRGLQALGVKLFLDDFGMGHSSLAYLKILPIDGLKIDSSFVTGLPLDPNDQDIVMTINTLARNVGIKVIAEGVESQEACDLLARMGCDFAQGFYFCPPLSSHELTIWLSQHRFVWPLAVSTPAN